MKYVDGRGEVHGYLTDREIARALIARWWQTTPDALRRIAKREYRLMAEFRDRVQKAEDDLKKAAQFGYPTPGHVPSGRPPQDEGW